MNRIQRLVVIGGSASGITAALRARRLRPDLDITVIEASPYISPANCSIPAYLSGEIEYIESLQVLKAETAISEHHLNLMLQHAVQKVEPVEHRVFVENLSTKQTIQIPYDRLIIATGASPLIANLPNIQSQGIFTLRNLTDSERLRNFIEQKKPAKFVIIGTGTIAQACASVFRHFGIQTTILGTTPRLMDDLEMDIADSIKTELTSNDVSVHIVDKIVRFNVLLDGNVCEVETSNGIYKCDGILLATGIKPNTESFLSSGISLTSQGVIRTDRHLMTSRQGIFACGDCATTFHRITHQQTHWPLATTAVRQGRIAGENAVGGSESDPGTLHSRYWTCFDLQIGRVGLSSHQADEASFKYDITKIDSLSRSPIYGGSEIHLIIITIRNDGRIIGAQLTGKDGVYARLNTLIAAIEGKLTLKEIENLDLAFTPQITNLWDPVHIAGRLGGKKKRNK